MATSKSPRRAAETLPPRGTLKGVEAAATKVVKVKRNQIEDGIQASIIDLLKVAAIPDLIYFAVPNGGFRDWQTAKKLVDTGMVPGVLDIVLIHPKTRVAHFLEVKTRTGRLNDAQVEFSDVLTRLGIKWTIVRSRDEAQVALTAWGLIQWPPA